MIGFKKVNSSSTPQLCTTLCMLLSDTTILLRCLWVLMLHRRHKMCSVPCLTSGTRKDDEACDWFGRLFWVDL